MRHFYFHVPTAVLMLVLVNLFQLKPEFIERLSGIPALRPFMDHQVEFYYDLAPEIPTSSDVKYKNIAFDTDEKSPCFGNRIQEGMGIGSINHKKPELPKGTCEVFVSKDGQEAYVRYEDLNGKCIFSGYFLHSPDQEVQKMLAGNADNSEVQGCLFTAADRINIPAFQKAWDEMSEY